MGSGPSAPSASIHALVGGAIAIAGIGALGWRRQTHR